MPLVLHKPKCWTNYNFDLTMALDEKLEDHQGRQQTDIAIRRATPME